VVNLRESREIFEQKHLLIQRFFVKKNQHTKGSPHIHCIELRLTVLSNVGAFKEVYCIQSLLA